MCREEAFTHTPATPGRDVGVVGPYRCPRYRLVEARPVARVRISGGVEPVLDGQIAGEPPEMATLQICGGLWRVDIDGIQVLEECPERPLAVTPVVPGGAFPLRLEELVGGVEERVGIASSLPFTVRTLETGVRRPNPGEPCC